MRYIIELHSPTTVLVGSGPSSPTPPTPSASVTPRALLATQTKEIRSKAMKKLMETFTLQDPSLRLWENHNPIFPLICMETQSEETVQAIRALPFVVLVHDDDQVTMLEEMISAPVS